MLHSKLAPIASCSVPRPGISIKVRRFHFINFKGSLPCVYSALGRLHSAPSCSHIRFFSNSINSCDKYSGIDGVERLELYESAGYHLVTIDDLLHKRYRIVDEPGFGIKYSTIWLVQDQTFKKYVALKVGISGPSFPRRESQILEQLYDSRSSSQACASHATPVTTDMCWHCAANHPQDFLRPWTERNPLLLRTHTCAR